MEKGQGVKEREKGRKFVSFTSSVKWTGNGSVQIISSLSWGKRKDDLLWSDRRVNHNLGKSLSPSIPCLNFGEFPVSSQHIYFSACVYFNNLECNSLCSLFSFITGFSDPQGRCMLLAEWLLVDSSPRDVLFQEWHISLGMTRHLTEVGGRSGEAPTQEKIVSLCAWRKTLRWWTAWFGGCEWVSHSSEVIFNVPS